MIRASELVSRVFNPVERAFLAMWLPRVGTEETAGRFEAAFGRKPDISQIKWFAERNRIRRAAPPRKAEWLNEEREAWLREHYGKRPIREVLAAFNERFGLALNYTTIKSAAKRFRLGKTPKSFPRVFGTEEVGWLREHLPKAPHKAVADAFESRFGWRPSDRQLKNFVTRYGCQGAPNTGRFYAGMPYNPNSGAKGPNRTSFKKGHRNNPEAELYEERRRYKHGKLQNVYVKIPGPAPHASIRAKGWQSRAHWVPKARWLWEREHGPIEDGQVVVCRDGDPANCVLDNLELVSRGVIARMNAHHAPKRIDPETEEGRELNVARLRLAQLKDGAAAASEARE